jgi:excisionase family DNA binding protein
MVLLIGAREAATMLGISNEGIYKMIRDGRLKAERTTPVIKVSLSVIEALKVSRAGKRFGRRPASVEIVTA